MFRVEKTRGRIVQANGKEYLYFSGTSYLGLAHHKTFRELLLEGLSRYGCNFGGSRRSKLQFPVIEEAERVLAQWIGTESALTASSGTMAGQLVVKTLRSLGHPLFFAPGIHPALNAPAHHFQGTYSAWVESLPDLSRQAWPVVPVLALSSIDVLHARRYELNWMEALPSEVPLIILIDDSHGLGVWGENGAGVFPELPQKENITYIVVASLAKACGIPGGVIACDQSFRKFFWDHPFFGGASPVVPAYLHAFVKAQDLLAQQLQRLHSNIRYFHAKIRAADHFRFLPDYPVFYTQEDGLADYLSEKNILISSFPYPGPEDPVITRIVLSASHLEGDLEELVNQLKSYFNEV
jgi:7-keto-8-aminopelargonate synthetase-like enzyme